MTQTDLDEAFAALADGRVVAAATESFFGLLVDATRADAVEALFSLKPRAQGVALILPTRQSWRLVVESISPLADALADRFWPGPLTLALPARPELDLRLTVDGTVGVRLPPPCAALALAERLGRPVTATSANVHGEPPVVDSASVRRSFGDAVSRKALHVVDGTSPGGEPSTVVVVKNRTLSVARVGAIAPSDIEAASRTAL